MRIKRAIFILAVLSFVSGCYWGITGRVIDAETQVPIEGAVVLAQWTDSHGIGLTYHTVHKIEEAETDREGKFSLSGVYSPFVDPPILVIYKNGYVAWRNDFVFPEYKERTDYDVWENNYVYKLEKFKKGSSEQYYYFLTHGIIGSSIVQTPIFSEIIHQERLNKSIEVRKK